MSTIRYNIRIFGVSETLIIAIQGAPCLIISEIETAILEILKDYLTALLDKV